MLRLLPTVLILAVWIYAFIDCLNTPENEVRKLPKVAWVLIILFFGTVLLGPVAWFAAGRPRRNAPYGATRAAERRWLAPDDNPEFLKSINERGRQAGQRPEPGDEPRADRKRDGEPGGNPGHDSGGNPGGNPGKREGDNGSGGSEEAPPAAS